MNNTNVLDNIYLALELTKIRYNKGCNNNNDIIETFFFNIEKLTGVNKTDIQNIDKIKKELGRLKLEHFSLQNEFDEKLDEIMNITYKKVIDCLESHKADMESYVYKDLKELLTNKK